MRPDPQAQGPRHQQRSIQNRPLGFQTAATLSRFSSSKGTAVRMGDSSSHAASATVVLMMVSNSIGVNRPSAACLRRRW